jgi:hypothetical protein
VHGHGQHEESELTDDRAGERAARTQHSPSHQFGGDVGRIVGGVKKSLAKLRSSGVDDA